MFIVDNAFPTFLFKSIKEKVTDNRFDWYYIPYTGFHHAEGDTKRQNYHFSHTCYGPRITPIHKEIIMGFTSALKRINIELSEIFRIRINLIPSVSDTSFISDAHIDNNAPHKNAILYLNDSEDGGTLIYNERYDPDENLTASEQYLKVVKNNFSVLQEVIPKENRMVIFDGYHYHASTTPSKIKARFAININFTTAT